jgi:hypothetical protein
MALTPQETISYFRAHQDYFWRWAEQGNVIEFANERTICYREDLSNVLEALPNTTSLSLGTVLLILCACKEDWETLFNAKAVLMDLGSSGLKDISEHDPYFKLTSDGYDFLCLLNRLPSSYRSDTNRTALLQCIFDALAIKGYHTGLLPVLREFNSGEMDEEIFGTMEPLARNTVVRDFAPLAAALSVFKDTETLETKLKTGIIAVPAPLVLPQPEPVHESLMDELERDDATRNIAGLARKIMAALYIPMHLDGKDEQNLGGISDISTKGTYDKLLLSELAYDDHLLSARLANNEALFLQKESVPKHRTQELGLIIDCTLKMWGAARVYAVAAAIAFHQSKRDHQKLRVWSLGGQELSSHGLETKNDVIALLEKLDLGLHCGEMLLKTAQDHIEKNGQYILITSPHFLNDPSGLPYLLKVRDRLDFMVTISSAGQLQMQQFNKNRSKMVHEAKIDMEELLSNRSGLNAAIVQHDLPAVLYQEKFPLYFPTAKIRVKFSFIFRLKNKGLVTVSIDHRLLYWPTGKFGAIELLGLVPYGQHCFGEDENSLYLMVISERDSTVKIVAINPDTRVHFLTEVSVPCKSVKGLKFTSPYFHFDSEGKQVVINVRNGEVIPEGKVDAKELLHVPQQATGEQSLKKHLNNGYSAISSSKTIYLHEAGRIVSDKKEFIVINNEFHWKENELAAVQWSRAESQEVVSVDHLPNIKFTKYTWKSGSTAIMDSRGLLHLKSWKDNVPEVCIIMIVDQPTACWCKDGYVSGSRYFIGDSAANYLEPAQFYERYIYPFIDSLP